MKRVLTEAVLIAVLTLGTSFQTLAGRIAFSDPSTTTGETVSVNMKVTSTGEETIGRADVTLSYDASMLEFVSGEGASGGAGTLKVTGSSNSTSATELAFVLTFRALRPGSTSITIADQEVYDSDSQLVNIEREGSSAITIAAAEGDSTNANLAGLQVSPGTLSPAFAKDVLEYTVTVGGDVESLVVDAPAVDSGASVSVSGNDGLQIGENTVVCTVTAQDGQTVKTYTITVTKVEGSADGAEASAPAEEGVILRTPERSVTVYPVTEDVPIPEGFLQAQVSIDGHDVQGWIWNGDTDAPRYCIFYATNENGETDFYRYDLSEKTIQRYFRDPLVDAAGDAEYAALVDNYNSLLNDYNLRFYIIIGLIALAVILLIVIIALVATRGGKDDFYEKQRQDGGNYPERHRSNRQGQSGAADAERRRLSREERYMRGLEEEEEAAEKEEAFRAERQIRERQAQRRQITAQGQQQGRPAVPQGQRPMVPQQPAQRPAGQSGDVRSAGAGQGREGARRSAGQPGGQRPAGSAQGQRPAAQPVKNTASEDQNYVVRGPLAGDEELSGAGRSRDVREPVPPKPQDGDDDFQIIDID